MTAPGLHPSVEEPYSESTSVNGAKTLPPPDASPVAAKAKEHNIRVSAAVLDAAARDGDDLLRSLRSSLSGLTQSEAERRTGESGPNEVAQEKQRGWFLSILIIIRNPLVILLAILSAISFATGDARAGSVMAGMVVLSVTLRFLQEARAGAAAAKLNAMIHVTATVVRDGKARKFRCAISSRETSSTCPPAKCHPW